MAVRVFTQKEVYKELKKAGFEPTDIKTPEHTVWKDKAGHFITVNHIETHYSYAYLSDLLQCVGINYNCSGSKVDIKKYNVTH